MPMKPKRPCRHPGCTALSNEVYCEAHRPLYARENAASRGYDGRWKQARKAYLRQHPLCAECMRGGKLTPSTVVDHITPHRGDMRLFWDKQNWQPLCKDCHDRKTGMGM